MALLRRHAALTPAAARLHARPARVGLGVGLLVLALGTAMPSVGAAITDHYVHDAVEHRAIAGNQAVAETAARDVATSWLRVRDAVARTAAGLGNVSSGPAGLAHLASALPQIAAAEEFCAVEVRGRDGRLIRAASLGTAGGAPCPAASSALQAHADGQVVVGSTVLFTRTAPIRSGGRVIGTVTAAQPASALLSSSRFGHTGSIAMVGSGGLVVLSGVPGAVGQKVATQVGRSLIAAGRPASVQAYSPRRHAEVLTSYVPVPGTPFGVFASVTTGEAFVEFDSIRTGLFLGLVLILAVAVVASAAVGRWVARRQHDLNRSHAELAASEGRLSTMIETSPLGMIVVSGHTIEQVNPAFVDLVGRPADALVGSSFFDVIHAEDRDGVVDSTTAPIETASQRVVEFRCVRPDGTERWVRTTTTPLAGMGASVDGAGPQHKLSVVQDITAARAAGQALRAQAAQDPLTGLSNRRHLVELMRQALRREDDLAVVYIDLDGVKQCNDTFGHAVVDELLVEVAATIRATVRGADAVARVGGDEFVVVFGEVSGRSTLPATLAERLRLAIESTARKHLPAGAVPVTASIGFTVSAAPHHEATPDLLIQEADAAMYEAKRAGKNRSAEYDRGPSRALGHQVLDRA